MSECLSWTLDKPTKAGWYWYRDDERANIVRVDQETNYLIALEWGLEEDWAALHESARWLGEWAGPIEPPQ